MNFWIFSLFVIIYLIKNTKSNNDKKYTNFDTKINSLLQIISDPNEYKFLFDKNEKFKVNSTEKYDDQLCKQQFLWFLSELKNTKLWALNMFDSWGKMPSGLMYGNFYEFGNFDQCLKVRQNSESLGEIRGQYCFNEITLTLAGTNVNTKKFEQNFITDLKVMPSFNKSKFNIGVGLCIPATCSPTFFNKNLNEIIKVFNLSSMGYNPDDMCYVEEGIKFEAIDWIAIVFFTIIVILLISSTIYDLIMRHYQKPLNLLLISFSIYSNGIKLFSCKKSKSPDVMYCLNGIRVLSIIWVVLGHTYLFNLIGAINTVSLADWVKSKHSMLILYATVSVDSFFLLSGILVTWSILKELQNTGKVNIPLIYFHRYLRLTPAFGVLILFCESLMRYCGTGPIWKIIYNTTIRECDKYWWSALLYVQNYVNPNEICLGHSWYLSVDVQLFFLAPLFVYPLWKWGKKIVGVIAVIILLSMACAFTTVYINHFTVNLINGGTLASPDQNKLIYYPTHIRMVTWLVGVVLGYILHLLRNKEFSLSKYWVICGWTVSLGTILAIIFGPYNLQQLGHVDNIVENSFYEACSRVSWSIALSWIIFACIKGYGGPINWFLSLAVWQPFARLTYSIYLLHMVIQTMFTGSIKTTKYFSDINTIHKFWGDLGLTLTVSIFWTLAFESPITVLERFLTKREPLLFSRNPLEEESSTKDA